MFKCNMFFIYESLDRCLARCKVLDVKRGIWLPGAPSSPQLTHQSLPLFLIGAIVVTTPSQAPNIHGTPQVRARNRPSTATMSETKELTKNHDSRYFGAVLRQVFSVQQTCSVVSGRQSLSPRIA